MRSWPVFFVVFFISVSALAASDTPREETGTSEVSTLGDGKTALVVDPKDGTVRVLIDGQEKLRIDAAGLHVRGDIVYSGALEDTGAAAAIPAQGEPAQKGKAHAP